MVMQRTPPASGELPRKGNLLPDLWLPTANGVEHTIAAYRGPRTCIVIAAGTKARDFLEQLTATAAEFRADEIAVLIIVPGAHDRVRALARDAGSGNTSTTNLILVGDPDARAHRRLAGPERNGEPPWAAYVTDQFGEIYALFREADGDQLPTAADLLDWARFVNIRCEECFPPEWPD